MASGAILEGAENRALYREADRGRHEHRFAASGDGGGCRLARRIERLSRSGEHHIGWLDRGGRCRSDGPSSASAISIPRAAPVRSWDPSQAGSASAFEELEARKPPSPTSNSVQMRVRDCEIARASRSNRSGTRDRGEAGVI
jgi:hypothetical protein